MFALHKRFFLLMCLMITLLLAGCGKTSAPETRGAAAAVSETSASSVDSVTVPSPATEGAEPSAKDTGASADGAPPVSPENDSSFIGPLYRVASDLKITHVSSYEGFLHESFGITVGTDGETHYTTDGGKTWPEAQIESHCRFGLDIVNEKIAWSCGNHWHIRFTTDGGKTWSKASDFQTVLTQGHISFIDDKTGWVASSINLGATTDSGQSWTELALPQGVKGIAAIDLRSAQVGYLLGTDGVLYATTDSGATWQQKGGLPLLDLNISDMKGNAGMLHVGQIPNVDMRFVDDQNGILIVIGFIEKQGFKVFRFETLDGGSTWTRLPLELPEGYHPNAVYLSKDGQYMNFSNNAKRVLLLKREP